MLREGIHTNTHFSWSDRLFTVLDCRVLVLLDKTSYLFLCQLIVSFWNCLNNQTSHPFHLPEPKRMASRGSLHIQSTQTSGHAPLVLVSVSAPPMDFHTSPMAFLTLLHHPRATTGLTKWLSATITETRIATPTTVRSVSAHGPSVRERDSGYRDLMGYFLILGLTNVVVRYLFRVQ